jgi:anaerobic ribonucleoside-triphosphate reductase activating protein
MGAQHGGDSGVRLSRQHYPVTTLGPGVRAAIWFQGCSIGCAGCMSQDTWEMGATTVDVATLVAWVSDLAAHGPLDGVTISGGEPFQQPSALADLLGALREWSDARSEPVDLMVYSGYALPALMRDTERARALDLCDVVVTGPYVRAQAPGGRWRGSANQELVIRTDLGRSRCGAADDVSDRARIQLIVDGGRLLVVGVPEPGDLDRIETGLASRGVTLEFPSWRGAT